MEVETTLTAIDRLADLPEGWDSYEAPKIAEVSRVSAKEFLNNVRRVLAAQYWNPLVGPTPEAGVVLIWRKENGPEVNVLLCPTGARFVLLGPDRQVVRHGPVLNYERFALDVLKRLEW